MKYALGSVLGMGGDVEGWGVVEGVSSFYDQVGTVVSGACRGERTLYSSYELRA